MAPTMPVARLAINNALVYLVSTPNSAGSVMPRMAVIPELIVTDDFSFDTSLLCLYQTAMVAPAIARLPKHIIGMSRSFPYSAKLFKLMGVMLW